MEASKILIRAVRQSPAIIQPVRVCRTFGRYSPRIKQGHEAIFRLIQHGASQFMVNGCRYHFYRNSLLICAPDETPCYIPQRGSRIESICLVLPFNIIDGLLTQSIFTDLPRVLTLSEKDATEIELLLKNISDEIENKSSFWCEKIIDEIRLFLILVNRCRTQKAAGRSYRPVVRNVVAYIEGHFADTFSLKRISGQFHMSVGYLSRIFRADVGMGIKQYLISRRIAEAKRLLAKINPPKIVSIAAQTGFRNQGLFNRHFKLVTGMKPSVYRNRFDSQGGVNVPSA